MRFTKPTVWLTALFFIALCQPLSAQWGDIRGVIDSAGRDRPSEQRYLYVYLSKPDRIHPDYPQNETEVRKQYVESFQKQNEIPFEKWLAAQQAVLESTKQLPKFPGPVTTFSEKGTLNRNHVVVRRGEYLPVVNMSEQLRSLSIPLLPSKTIRLLKPGQAASMFVEPPFTTFEVTCYINPKLRFVIHELDHPYFQQVGQDGTFHLKNVPAGQVKLVIVSDNTYFTPDGNPGKRKGTVIEVPEGGVLDLGTIVLEEER